MNRRAKRAFAFLCIGGLVAAAAATATTGLVPVDGIIASGEDPEATHEHGESQAVIARGEGRVAGPWRLTALKRSGDTHAGEGPADCLQLQLSDPPPGTPIEATMLCQGPSATGLAAGSLPVINSATDEAELLLFGSAPREAEEVVLTGDERRARSETEKAATGFAARSWVIAVPRGWSSGHLAWLQRDGEAGVGPTLDASLHLDRLREVERIAQGSE